MVSMEISCIFFFMICVCVCVCVCVCATFKLLLSVYFNAVTEVA